MDAEVKNAEIFWDKKHLNYERRDIICDDWLEKFEAVIKGCTTPVLDLGCGSGNNTLYLIAVIDCCAGHRADSRVHTWSITARGKNTDTFNCCHNISVLFRFYMQI